MANYKILSLDGGPSNATYLRLLREIEKQRPGFLAQADLFSGTSDGAISSIYMASRPSSEDGLTSIENCIALSDEVFTSAQPGCFGLLRLLTGLLSMDNNKKLQHTLEQYYGPHTELGDLPRKITLVSYRLSEQSGPKVYNNFPGDPDEQLNATDVALSSSAFPVLLPIHEGHVDGAIFANNPSMCALTQTLAAREHLPDVKSLDDISIFSLGGDDKHIGTALDQFFFQRCKNQQWGWIPWMLQPLSPMLIFDLIVNSNGRGVSFQCQQLIGDSFFRLAPIRRTEITELLWVVLNNSKKVIRKAEQLATFWSSHPNTTEITPNMSDTLKWVDEHWMNPPKGQAG